MFFLICKFVDEEIKKFTARGGRVIKNLPAEEAVCWRQVSFDACKAGKSGAVFRRVEQSVEAAHGMTHQMKFIQTKMCD